MERSTDVGMENNVYVKGTSLTGMAFVDLLRKQTVAILWRLHSYTQDQECSSI